MIFQQIRRGSFCIVLRTKYFAQNAFDEMFCNILFFCHAQNNVKVLVFNHSLHILTDVELYEIES